MQAIKLFNGLHGAQVSRNEIERIIDLAKKENQTDIVYRLSKVLRLNDDELIEIDVVQYPSSGLNGAMHKGSYKEALDDCGRLRPGFKFQNGTVVKVVKKTPKPQPKPIAKTVKKAVKKTQNVKIITATSKKATDIFNVPISKINVDTARFQNRNKLNETVLEQIVENYSTVKLDPVIIWIDKNKKTYLLAGHHRFEATKRVGKKTIAAKYFTGTEAEAINYAKVESNANRSLELPQERAKLYREMIAKGKSKTQVATEAKKLEGKNANYILNLSYLNPKGIVLTAVDQLSDTNDKQNASLIEKIADWIGEVRRNNEALTNAHESEMFSFLQDKEASKRIKSKAEFKQKIHAIAGGFDFDGKQPLNLKRFKTQTEGEKVYNTEYKELQAKIDALLLHKSDINDRIKNPNNPLFVSSKDKEFETVMAIYDDAIAKINNEIKFFQKKIIDLQRNKGTYTNAGINQVGLFGPNKKRTRKTKPLKGIVENLIVSTILGEPKVAEAEVKANRLMQMNFETLAINEEWQELMQEPAANMKIAIYGPPKNGKTAGSLKLANYLTDFGNVLYNFADQGFNKSTQDLWKMSGLADNPKAEPSDISSTASLEKKIATGKYKFVFIDMISDYIRTEKLRPEEFKERFIKKFPNVSFILIFEVTKGGNFKGDQGWTHLVDAIMNVEDFVMRNRGRYGMGQRIIWEKGFKTMNPKAYNEYLQTQTHIESETTEVAPVVINHQFNFETEVV